MSSIATQMSFLIRGIATMRLRNFIPTRKRCVDDPTKPLKLELILIGCLAWLQPNDPPQIPTMTMAIVIALILFLFIVCPYIIGKILSKPEWREDEEAMGAELPQWETTDNWADLFPRYLAGDIDGSNRSKVSPKK